MISLGLTVSVGPARTSPAAATTTAGPAATLSDCWPSDNGDPDLLSFRVAPTTIDVRRHAAWLTLTATSSDDGGPGPATGVRSVLVNSIRGEQELVRQTDGSWQGRVRIPRGVEPGRNSISSVYIDDDAGHYRYYNSPWMRVHGFTIDYYVRSRADQKSPVLRSLRLRPDSVDTRRSPQKVVISAHVTDNRSGTEHILVVLSSGGGPGSTSSYLRLRRGTPRDGIWRGTVIIPRWVGSGRWSLFVETGDHAGRGDQFGADALAEQGLTSTFSVRSRTENDRPRVLAAIAQPAAVDATSADTRYAVTVHATDALSGVGYVGVRIITPWMAKEGVDLDDVDPEVLHRISGTRRDGVWRVAVPVSRCWSDPGTYTLQMFASDRAGNLRGPVAARKVLVVTGDNTPPYPRDARPYQAATTDPVTYFFSEDVTGISDTSAPVLPGGPWFRTSTNEPPGAQPGTWLCHSAGGTVTDCYTGIVRSATWTPSVPLTPGQEYGVDFNPEHVLDVMDLTGNPIDQPYIVNWTVTTS